MLNGFDAIERDAFTRIADRLRSIEGVTRSRQDCAGFAVDGGYLQINRLGNQFEGDGRAAVSGNGEGLRFWLLITIRYRRHRDGVFTRKNSGRTRTATAVTEFCEGINDVAGSTHGVGAIRDGNRECGDDAGNSEGGDRAAISGNAHRLLRRIGRVVSVRRGRHCHRVVTGNDVRDRQRAAAIVTDRVSRTVNLVAGTAEGGGAIGRLDAQAGRRLSYGEGHRTAAIGSNCDGLLGGIGKIVTGRGGRHGNGMVAGSHIRDDQRAAAIVTDRIASAINQVAGATNGRGAVRCKHREAGHLGLHYNIQRRDTGRYNLFGGRLKAFRGGGHGQ